MKWVRKGIAIVVAILALTFVTFLLFQVLPGDSAIVKLGTNQTPEALEALREEMGLNDPVIVRYGRWLAGVFVGDFGKSVQYNRPVSDLLWQFLPNTLLLAALSIVMIIVISFPFGLLYGRFPGSAVDRGGAMLNQTLMAVPAFFLGMLISVVLGLWMQFFIPMRFVPYSDGLGPCISYLIFPALAIAIPKAAMTIRFLRSSILTERSKDYVRTARSKGLTEGTVLMRHILPNALPGVRTFIGVIISEIIAGSIVVEQVFNVDGLGRLLVQSISNRDYNVVQAIVLYIGIVVLLVNSGVESE